MKTLRHTLLATAVVGAACLSTPAVAGVSASAGVANIYLWRGQSLSGGGVPVVSGSLDYGHDSGLFAGVWGSSGDSSWGTETDLYAGYAYSGDAFSLKATYWDYSYARTSNPAATGDLQEAQLSASIGGLFADAYIGTADSDGNNYLDIGYTLKKVTAKLGAMDTEEDALGNDTGYVHLDLTYAYNERLAFTVSGILDAGSAAPVYGEEDPLFVVSYTLPLELK